MCEREFDGPVDRCPDDNAELVTLPERPAEEDPFLGQVFNKRYRVDRRLGAGGMGSVYEAQQLNLGRSVALKMMKPAVARDPDMVKRFLREVRLVSALTHPNTITVYDFGLAKVIRPGYRTELTKADELVGTPAYLSPEQARGGADLTA